MLFKFTSQKTLFVSFDKLTQRVTWRPRRPDLKARCSEGHINKDALSGLKWNQTPLILLSE